MADWVERAADYARKAAAEIDGQGSHRVRVLVQMLLQELERERALLEAERKGKTPAPSPRG